MKLITDLRKDLDCGNVTSEELFSNATSLAHKYQEEYNSFVTILDKYNHKASNSLIKLYFVEDSIELP